MAAMSIFLALCVGGIAFLSVFFIALCLEGRRSHRGVLVKVGQRVGLGITEPEATTSAKSALHVCQFRVHSEASRKANAL